MIAETETMCWPIRPACSNILKSTYPGLLRVDGEAEGLVTSLVDRSEVNLRRGHALGDGGLNHHVHLLLHISRFHGAVQAFVGQVPDVETEFLDLEGGRLTHVALVCFIDHRGL